MVEKLDELLTEAINDGTWVKARVVQLPNGDRVFQVTVGPKAASALETGYCPFCKAPTIIQVSPGQFRCTNDFCKGKL